MPIDLVHKKLDLSIKGTTIMKNIYKKLNLIKLPYEFAFENKCAKYIPMCQ
jgi:hypothetical protein